MRSLKTDALSGLTYQFHPWMYTTTAGIWELDGIWAGGTGAKRMSVRRLRCAQITAPTTRVRTTKWIFLKEENKEIKKGVQTPSTIAQEVTWLDYEEDSVLDRRVN